MKRLLPYLALLLVGCATTGTSQTRTAADPVKLRKELAKALIAHGEWLSASQPLLELSTLTPEDAEVHALLADVYREEGLYDQAEREYAAALQRSPESAHALGGLGVLRDLRGDPGDAALEPLRRATTLEPNNAALQNNLGFALYIRGRYREALTPFGEALRLEPGSCLARNNLAFTYGRLGELDRARREFDRAGSRAASENNVGFLHELAGDARQACESYRAAIVLDGSLKVAFDNAQRACAKAERSSP